MDIQQKIKDELKRVIVKLGGEVEDKEIVLSPSDTREHGDYASNLAMRKAKVFHKNPMDLANDIIAEFSLDGVDHIEACKPGFLNFFLKQDELGSIIKTIVSNPEHYGDLDMGKGIKVDIEYVSANPTGTLHLGHARGAALGDCLARLYKKAGYDVTREYYVNDAGVQMDHLAESLMVRYLEEFSQDAKMPEDGYHGPEIIALAKELKEKVGDSYLADPESHLEDFKKFGGMKLLDAIKKDLHDFRVDQDVYTSEKAIRQRGDVEKVLQQLKPFCYEQDGALWLNTTKDGDDKDRVLVKSDGNYTYLLPDIAYHNDKFNRGFDLLIDLFGADHHGYICRVKAAISAMGYDAEKLDVLLLQMVRLLRGGQMVKLSKRTGQTVTLAELIEEVGTDAARYFFIMRSMDSQLDFDLDLAKSRSNENPVYYIQYAHARICSIFRQAAENGLSVGEAPELSLLQDDTEVAIINKLQEYEEEIDRAAAEYAPQRIARYAYELAGCFHSFYNQCRILGVDDKLAEARLALVNVTAHTIRHALGILGVSAPEKM